MSEDFRARIKHKRDTSANWTQNNPVILNGEIIIVDTDNGVRIKVGDGVKKYTQLPFDDELLRSLIDEKVPISQGASEAGKIMKVDSSGNIIPSTIEGSGNILVTNTDSGIDIGMSDSIDVSSINMHGLTITGTNDPSASTLDLSGTNPVAVKGIATPTENDDAANKLYADTRVVRDSYTITLPSTGWTNSAPYSQTVTVNGILATDTPYIAPVYSSTSSTATAEKKAWNFVSMAESFDNTVVFTCFNNKPATNLNLKIEVVRYSGVEDGSGVSY